MTPEDSQPTPSQPGPRDTLTNWLATWAPPERLLEFEERFAGVHHYVSRPSRCRVARASRDQQIVDLWDAGEGVKRIARVVGCHHRTVEKVVERERKKRRAA